MGIIFLAFATIGLFCIMGNIISALGSITCALLKYMILPFVLLFFLCGIIKYGL